MSGTHQALQHLLYSGERVGILLHEGIQVAEVNTKMQAAIFLPYQHHSISPCTLAGSDGTRFQHFLQLIPNLLNQWWWNSSKSFFKGSVIHYFYYMFHGRHTAKLCQIQGEHVMIFSQEPVSCICQLWGPRIQAA